MGYFVFEKVSLSNGKEWNVSKATIAKDSNLYLKAIEQAQMKAAHTMVASQAGQYRSPELKFNRQLMGTLAEITAQEFLKEGIRALEIEDKWEIIRYDDIRTDDFKSPENEYDIKAFRLVSAKKEYFIESRSSIVKDRSLTEAIDSFHIIGSYNSIAKNQEKPNDFYLLPLHYITNRASSYLPSRYQEYFENGDIQIYIVSGCSHSFLERQGSINNLQQGTTQYKVIKASQATDALEFQKRFSEFLNNKIE